MQLFVGFNSLPVDIVLYFGWSLPSLQTRKLRAEDHLAEKSTAIRGLLTDWTRTHSDRIGEMLF